jgi:N,N'-diacetylbacillosaminyl-diphospho-undecaprenol alpha-1,3-N-acetylgalactosaminyltransferase
MWHFRRELVKRLLDDGHTVTIYAPDNDRTDVDSVELLRDIGAEYMTVPIYRFFNPMCDFLAFRKLYRLLLQNKPDIVFTMSIKPNTFGAITAHWAGVRHIVGLVCGAGYAFETGGSFKQKLIRKCARLLYRWGSKYIRKMWFLNHDDRDLFIEKKITTPDQSTVIVSEGVNLQDYCMTNVPSETITKIRNEFDADDETVVVGCCPGRNTWSKGVKEFVETAKEAENWDTKVRFVLVGSPDSNAHDSVPENYYKNIQLLKSFRFRSDIRDVVASVDILTLPSFYREGVPRILLEGLAMGKPIVTTDSVGCRETVNDGVNGFLVPPQNTESFANAVKGLVFNASLRKNFGEQSFQKAVNEFDIHKINERVIAEVLELNDSFDS